MADRGIQFSPTMVLSLLADLKTQTRRTIAPYAGADVRDGDILLSWPSDADVRTGMRFRPRFRVGDRLWVKEMYRGPHAYELHGYKPKDWGNKPIWYCADGEPPEEHAKFWSKKARPSIHMPKFQSRLTLIVTDVRVQRLQDISAADCRAEGHPIEPGRSADPAVHDDAARDWYMDLWNHINGAGSWETNPFVAAYTFTVHKTNIERMTG